MVMYHHAGINLKYYLRNIVLILLAVGLVSAACATLAARNYFCDIYDEEILKKEDTIADLETAAVTLRQENNAQIRTLVSEHEDELQDYQEVIDDKDATIEELNLQLEKANEVKEARIAEEVNDFQILQKYWYVLKECPDNTEITVDVLRYCDEVCKEWNVNPHWMWAIFWRESNWLTGENNPSTNARGLGQIMPGTGKEYWEKILGHGSYTHTMAYDPYVNIEISVAHIGRNHSSSMENSIKLYSGGSSDAYNAIIRLAKSKWGISLGEFNRFYE